jgi:hypothetical protein
LISQSIFIPLETRSFKSSLLSKGTWLALLHAQRIPPHAGLIFNGNYNSLTIKEAELNIESSLLLETISRKKIKTIFVKIIPHPVFSLDHQREMFAEELKKHGCVQQGKATCLSPVKTFFRDFYAIDAPAETLLFNFITFLQDNRYTEFAMAANMEIKNGIDLPYYTQDDLDEKIKTERQTYFNS